VSHYHLQKLGQRLRELRQRRGLTQAKLAQQAGVTRLKVIAIEAGRESVVIGSYARVAAALGSELSLAVLTRPTLEELAEVFDGSR
jgi:HTH-type transcriptional regulator/antitoxin HipB